MKSQIIVIIIAVVLVSAIVQPFTRLVFAATDNHEGSFNLHEVITHATHDVHEDTEFVGAVLKNHSFSHLNHFESGIDSFSHLNHFESEQATIDRLK
jgi:hypothetical protein